MGAPSAPTKRATYENIVVDCPACGHENIFNRATDLKDFEPVDCRTEQCQRVECGMPFSISGDSINSAHEMLVYDCYELMRSKHYMNCVLTLSQAHEVFFSLFLRVELLYKPFAADPEKDIERLNSLAQDLQGKIKKHAFDAMRSYCLLLLVSGNEPKNLAAAEKVIRELLDGPASVKDKQLEALADAELVGLLKKLKNTKVHELRNKVVHHQAYRPSRDEVLKVLQESQSLLDALTRKLRLRDDINSYLPNGDVAIRSWDRRRDRPLRRMAPCQGDGQAD